VDELEKNKMDGASKM